jgi:hypothetical protein
VAGSVVLDEDNMVPVVPEVVDVVTIIHCLATQRRFFPSIRFQLTDE